MAVDPEQVNPYGVLREELRGIDDVLRSDLRGIDSALRERLLGIDAVMEERSRAIDEKVAHLGTLTEVRFESIAQLMREKDLRDQQRFDAQQLALRDALLAQEKAVSAALLAAQEAVAKAETAAEKRFDAVNEFRAQLADQAATLMPRTETQVILDGMNTRIDGIAKGLDDKIQTVAALGGSLATRVETYIAGGSGEKTGHADARTNQLDARTMFFGALMALVAIGGLIVAAVKL